MSGWCYACGRDLEGRSGHAYGCLFRGQTEAELSTQVTGRRRRVPQERYLWLLAEVGGSAPLDEVAEYLGVSQATARRKLDGLAAQGLAERWPGSRGSGPACYGLTEGGKEKVALGE